MQITERIWVVASGEAGFGLTNPYDCTVYLVDCGQGFVLIDAGVGIDTPQILEQIRKARFTPDECLAILLTHAHADHAGGAMELSEATDASVFASEETARYLSEGDINSISLPPAIAAGVYPPEYRFSTCPVMPVRHMEKLKTGDICFEAIETPGHSNGHMAYLAEIDGIGVLFSGDCIYPGGFISLQPIWDCSIAAYQESINRLADLEFQALLPSHHGLLLQNGKKPVLEAKNYFERMMIPPGI